MFFDIALQITLIIFLLGVAYKLITWFTKTVGVTDQKDNLSFLSRLMASIKGGLATIFSPKIVTVVKVLILDVLFQGRILRDKGDLSAWFMHFLIFVGFMGLLIFHALGSIFSVALDPDYQSTLNPFMFLRNLFGFLAIVGLVLSILRRAVFMKGKIKTTGMDIYAITIVAVIVVSGFVLEGLKINSHAAFSRMVEEYGDSSDKESMDALEAYWVAHYNLASKNVQLPVSEETMALGKEWHEMSCGDCHSTPGSAFVSNAIATATKPISLKLDSAGVQQIVWYIHVLACFFGLAFLAFTKMFHVVTTPLSILVADVSGKDQSPAAAATRQALELSGCSHGGACHQECPVRIKRQERIDEKAPFEPVFDYIDTKSGGELGNREARS